MKSTVVGAAESAKAAVAALKAPKPVPIVPGYVQGASYVSPAFTAYNEPLWTPPMGPTWREQLSTAWASLRVGGAVTGIQAFR